MLDTDNGRRMAAPASARTAEEWADATDATPGMGAERMAMTQWVPGRLFGYQPRHRSTRQAADVEWLPAETWDEPTFEWNYDPRYAEQLADPEPQADQLTQDDQALRSDEFGPARQGEPDLHDHMSSDQLRHLLEGCALDDVARIVRPLVQIIAHSSHTATTLASAWGEFRRSTRDAYALHIGASRWSDFFRREELGFYPAEDAVELKLREADNAWRFITTGVP
jgi:hypothetical protein